MNFDVSYENTYRFFLKEYKDFYYKRKNSHYTLYNNSVNYDLLKVFDIEQKDKYEYEDLKKSMHTVFNTLNQGTRIVDMHMMKTSDIVDLCVTQKISTNCLTFAIVLQRVFSSMGHTSRIVRCLPIDIHYGDCHVITEVFDLNKKKWLFFDAANDVVFEDENGILSILEIRSRLINGGLLPTCVGPMWKTDFLGFEINKYRIYLTKNFIRFNTPINDKSLYSLVPKRYYKPNLPAFQKLSVANSINTFMVLYTDSATDFWSNPIKDEGFNENN